MIKYSIMSPSGKINVSFYDYDLALKIYNQNKDLWSDLFKNIKDAHISYVYKNGKIKKGGYLTDKQFLNDCIPKKYWEMWYDGSPAVIIDDFSIIEDEKKNAIENEDIDNFHWSEIMVSDFERSLMPEFDGF